MDPPSGGRHFIANYLDSKSLLWVQVESDAVARRPEFIIKFRSVATIISIGCVAIALSALAKAPSTEAEALPDNAPEPGSLLLLGIALDTMGQFCGFVVNPIFDQGARDHVPSMNRNTIGAQIDHDHSFVPHRGFIRADVGCGGNAARNSVPACDCPLCGERLVRMRRRSVDRLLSVFFRVYRFRCVNFQCQWEGSVRRSKIAPLRSC